MSEEYRIIRKKYVNQDNVNIVYELHTVYTQGSQIIEWSENPVTLREDSVLLLTNLMTMVISAIGKPIMYITTNSKGDRVLKEYMEPKLGDDIDYNEGGQIMAKKQTKKATAKSGSQTTKKTSTASTERKKKKKC